MFAHMLLIMSQYIRTNLPLKAQSQERHIQVRNLQLIKLLLAYERENTK